MVTQRRLTVLYGILVAAVLGWLYGQWNNDTRRVRHRLEALAEVVEKDSAEGDLVAANKGRLVGNFFCRQFDIQLRPFAQQMQDRARLAQVMLGYRRGAESIAVGLDKVQIAILEGSPKRAEMSSEVEVRGTVDGSRRREAYRFTFRWLEEDGQWCVEQAELLEVIEGLEGLF